MVAYLSRTELRVRWRSILLLGVLAALVVATVLTALAGARRSRTAFDRYLAAMAPIDVGVFGEDPAALAAVADLPHVERYAPIDLVAVHPVERPGEEFYPMLVSLDGAMPYELMRPKVVAGRLPDPDDPFGVALAERTARRLDKAVGDTIPMGSFTPDGVLAEFDGEGEIPGPDGPSFELTVTAIVREPADLAARDTDTAFTLLTPAFRERFPSEVIGSLGTGGLVALDDPGSIAAFAEAAAPLGLQVDPRIAPAAMAGPAEPTMGVIATALQVFAAVAAVAGTVTIGQAFGRSLQPALRDEPTLEALGVGRAARWLALIAPRLGGLALGAVAGASLAVIASAAMPVGLARRAEPDPGVHVDGLVLGVGLAAVLLVLVLVAVASTAMASRAARRAQLGGRPSRIADAVANVGAAPPRTIGLAFAGLGRSSTSPPSRAAVAGVAAGVVGLVAAFTFGASVDRLASTPGLYGWGWDAGLIGADLSHVPEGSTDVDALLTDPEIEAVAEVTFQLEAMVQGEPAYATVLDQRKGMIEPTVVEGRPPAGPGEVALAGDTLAATGRSVGETVAVDLGEGARQLSVTGVVALPVPSDGGSSSTGLLMDRAAAGDLGFTGDCGEDGSCYRNIAVEVPSGADAAVVLEPYVTDDVAVDLPVAPGEVEQLLAVEALPWSLAGFLALLATVAVVHASTAAVRRRRRDLAVLRVIGLTARQLRSVVTTQVAALSAAGAAVGTVVGLVAGRQVWRAVVDGVPLPFAPATPVLLIAAVVLSTLALAQLAAAAPRRAAGRISPTAALRAE